MKPSSSQDAASVRLTVECRNDGVCIVWIKAWVLSNQQAHSTPFSTHAKGVGHISIVTSAQSVKVGNYKRQHSKHHGRSKCYIEARLAGGGVGDRCLGLTLPGSVSWNSDETSFSLDEANKETTLSLMGSLFLFSQPSML